MRRSFLSRHYPRHCRIGSPILRVKHDEPTQTSSYHTHGPWDPIKEEVAPVGGEAIIVKQQNCAFIGTDLDTALRGMQADRLVLAGVVIHNSIDATLCAGKAIGYEIILPSDATTAVPVVGTGREILGRCDRSRANAGNT